MPAERLYQHDVSPLKVFSYYSVLGQKVELREIGASSPANLVERAVQTGHGAMALTDPNVMGVAEYLKVCNEKGLKPLPGIQLPVSFDGVTQMPVIFLARNNEGLLTLFDWVTKVYRNRQNIDPSDIASQKSNVFTLFQNEFSKLTQFLEATDNAFFALTESVENPEVKARIDELENVTGKTIVAGEVRMARAADDKTLRFLLRVFEKSKKGIRTGSLLDYSIKHPREINIIYQRFPKALAHNRELVQEVAVTVPQLPVLKAKIAEDEGMDSHEYLEREVLAASARIKDAGLTARIRQELALIKQLNLSDYILICLETARYCKLNNIVYQTTGSGNNSAVLWVLGITQVDPRDLSFEAFVHPDRPDSPDVDFEIPQKWRAKVADYLLGRYGTAAFAVEINRMRLKTINYYNRKLKLGLPVAERRELARVGLPHHLSPHPGIVFSGNLPLSLQEETVIAELDKDAIGDVFKLPKVDLLQRNGVVRLQGIRELVEEDGIEAKITANNRAALDRLFFEGKTIGVSELESPHLRRILTTIGRLLKQNGKRLTFDYIGQALALARLLKPARDRYYQYLREGTNNLAQFANTHPELKDILGRTNYVIIFQGQLRRLAALAGMDFSDGEKLKKLMWAGFSEEKRNEILAIFAQGLVRHGFSDAAVKEITEQIKNFTPFGFREGHSRAKALTAYKLAFLAERIPAYFWSAVLQIAAERPDSHLYPLQAYVNEALRDGIEFLFPEIDLLPAKPVIKDSQKKQIMMGRSLLPDKDYTDQAYSMFQHDWAGGQKSPRELAGYQIRYFGVSFTDNPAVLFDANLRFNPKRNRQEIAGQWITKRPYGKIIFVTLDSGVLVNAVMPREFEKRQKDLFEYRFWQMTIKRSREDSWEIEAVRPLPQR